MKKWAIIENSEVVNVILWDGKSSRDLASGQNVVEITTVEDEEQAPGNEWSYINN